MSVGWCKPSLLLHGLITANILFVVVEQLLDEIDMRQKHPPAAVPLEAELVERVATKRHKKRG